MLFQRLFNWIKYKTLPQSVLFKNRLFVERDSKHRRIFNNFGLTFRNSKWTNYEMYNVKFHFQWTYYKYFFALIFATGFFLIFFFHTKLYLSYPLLNLVSFFIWTSVDSFDYYLSFFIWSAIVLNSMFLNAVYAYFFFAIYGDTTDLKLIFSNRFFYDNKVLVHETEKHKHFTNHDYKLILFGWILNSGSITHEKVLNQLFNSYIPKDQFSKFSNFFFNLYSLTYLCKLTLPNLSSFAAIEKINRLQKEKPFYDQNLADAFFSASNLTTKHAALTLWYNLSQYPNYFDSLNLQVARKKSQLFFDWSCASIAYETNLNNELLSTKTGQFKFYELTNSLFSELSSNNGPFWHLSSFLKSHVQLGKWHRWLYRYSILHRKLLKNSHKITITKRLINSGFFSRSLFEKNLWASETFQKISNPLLCTNSYFQLLYGDFYKTKVATDYLKSTLQSTTLAFSSKTFELGHSYESSYFWFLKRFFLFNTLPATFATSSLNKPNFKHITDIKSIILDRNNTQSSNLLLTSYQTSTRYPLLNSFYINSPWTTFTENLSSSKIPNALNLNDLFLSTADNYLLVSDHLELLNWITTNTLLIHSSLSYNTKSTALVQKFNAIPNKFEVNQNSKLNELTFWLNYPGTLTDQQALTDFVFITFFK